jgi:HTH-type transcriptional regulator / antitoxin HipB
MKDNITLADLGTAVRAARLHSAKTTTEIAAASGRSRDVLHRLERGQDVSVSSLLNILSAIGYSLSLQRAGRPTLAQMRERFADLDKEEEDEQEEDASALHDDHVRRVDTRPAQTRPSPRPSRTTRKRGA